MIRYALLAALTFAATANATSLGPEEGKTYRVSYKVTGSYTSTNPIHWVRLRGNTVANGALNSGDGVFVSYLVAPAGVWSLDIRPGSGFAGVLDEVSVREVLP